MLIKNANLWILQNIKTIKILKILNKIGLCTHEEHKVMLLKSHLYHHTILNNLKDPYCISIWLFN